MIIDVRSNEFHKTRPEDVVFRYGDRDEDEISYDSAESEVRGRKVVLVGDTEVYYNDINYLIDALNQAKEMYSTIEIENEEE